MPTLEDHNPTKLVKALLVGNSGEGKTGSLASLVNMLDLDLWIWDFDNGLDILSAYVMPEKFGKVHFKTFVDKSTAGTQGASVAKATAFPEAMQAFQKWKEPDGESFGSIYDRGPEDVVVVDSMTMLGNAAMNYTLAVNGRAGQHPWMSDWGEAMNRQEGLMELLYADAVKCHVIVTAHIYKPTKLVDSTNAKGEAIQIEVEGDRGFVSALGKKLPPKIPRYFNAVLRTYRYGNAAPIIRTVADEDIDLKNPNPPKIPRQLPLSTGLADYFSLVAGVTALQSPKKSPTR